MGGDPNGRGYISLEKLKQVIQKDFELTIDIDVSCVVNWQRLIKDVDRDSDGGIDYEEFKSLLKYQQNKT